MPCERSSKAPAFQSRSRALSCGHSIKIIPVKISEIALFHTGFRLTQLVTFSGQKYLVNHTLDELEDICPGDFYRANRQFLINREVVQEVIQHLARKLLVKLKITGDYEVLISKNKVPEFLGWLRS